LRETAQDLQEQVRTALGLGIAEDRRRLVEGQPLPAGHGQQGFSGGAQRAAD
jgi:hypothetical protein